LESPDLTLQQARELKALLKKYCRAFIKPGSAYRDLPNIRSFSKMDRWKSGRDLKFV
jgi:hypothetical protein